MQSEIVACPRSILISGQIDKWTDHLPLLYPFEHKSSGVAPPLCWMALAGLFATPRMSNREETITVRILAP